MLIAFIVVGQCHDEIILMVSPTLILTSRQWSKAAYAVLSKINSDKRLYQGIKQRMYDYSYYGKYKQMQNMLIFSDGGYKMLKFTIISITSLACGTVHTNICISQY